MAVVIERYDASPKDVQYTDWKPSVRKDWYFCVGEFLTGDTNYSAIEFGNVRNGDTIGVRTYQASELLDKSVSEKELTIAINRTAFEIAEKLVGTHPDAYGVTKMIIELELPHFIADKIGNGWFGGQSVCYNPHQPWKPIRHGWRPLYIPKGHRTVEQLKEILGTGQHLSNGDEYLSKRVAGFASDQIMSSDYCFDPYWYKKVAAFDLELDD